MAFAGVVAARGFVRCKWWGAGTIRYRFDLSIVACSVAAELQSAYPPAQGK